MQQCYYFTLYRTRPVKDDRTQKDQNRVFCFYFIIIIIIQHKTIVTVRTSRRDERKDKNKSFAKMSSDETVTVRLGGLYTRSHQIAGPYDEKNDIRVAVFLRLYIFSFYRCGHILYRWRCIFCRPFHLFVQFIQFIVARI